MIPLPAPVCGRAPLSPACGVWGGFVAVAAPGAAFRRGGARRRRCRRLAPQYGWGCAGRGAQPVPAGCWEMAAERAFGFVKAALGSC